MGSHGERAASLTKIESGHDARARGLPSPAPVHFPPPGQFAHTFCLARRSGAADVRGAARRADVCIRSANFTHQQSYLLGINRLGFLLTNRAAGALIIPLLPCRLACGKGRIARGRAAAVCKPGREHIGGAKRRSE